MARKKVTEYGEFKQDLVTEPIKFWDKLFQILSNKRKKRKIATVHRDLVCDHEHRYFLKKRLACTSHFFGPVLRKYYYSY